MTAKPDSERVAEAASRILDLESAWNPDAKSYNSLTLCLIDAVFSIGVRYEQVAYAVRRYCDRYGLKMHRNRYSPLPRESEQDPVSALLRRINSVGSERFSAEVLRNKGRTSPRNGILKAEAVRRFAAVLAGQEVECLQDLPKAVGNRELENAVKRIPGQWVRDLAQVFPYGGWL